MVSHRLLTDYYELPKIRLGSGRPFLAASKPQNCSPHWPGFVRNIFWMPVGQKDASPTDELGLPEEVEDTEQARLEYTRKATDLALKYLRNHQDNPSDELLEDLGITAEQLREMVSRYEQLQQVMKSYKKLPESYEKL